MIYEGNLHQQFNFVYFYVCTINNSALKIYIFINSHLTKTFRMSYNTIHLKIQIYYKQLYIYYKYRYGLLYNFRRETNALSSFK